MSHLTVAVATLNSLFPQNRFHLDPSGTYTQYEAKAIGERRLAEIESVVIPVVDKIGSGSEGAQTALQEVYNKVSLISS